MRYLILFFSLLLFSCGEAIVVERSEEYEFAYNYILLKSYFFRPERLKEFSEYEGFEIDSMYSSLNDYFLGHRYTRYYKPDTSEKVIEDIQNSPKQQGIFGFKRTLINDTLVVSTVYPISPAANAGLKKYDKLLFTDNISLTNEAASRYSDSDSLFNETTVLKVLRGQEILTLEAMQKSDVKMPTVFLDSLNNIPYITVTEFTNVTNNPNGTYAEFKNILQQIKGAKTAIINLRNNLGGNVGHCTAMAAELSPLDKELIYDIEHQQKNKVNVIDTVHYYAKDFLDRQGYGLNTKWIILINNLSASCSERFTVAVKSARPETVTIGQNSIGKGVGQIYTTTPANGLAYITFMESFSPDGKPIHEVGITPDIPANNDEEIYSAIMNSAQSLGFGVLAKRQTGTVEKKETNVLLPEYKTRKTEPSMYRIRD